ncbi:MAG: DUF1735 domain-containing protein [Bacteroidales bacterium]|nr:DUF1735 domain-containing protein [Bacteroidales bacterium]
MKATKLFFSALAAVLVLGACTKNIWIDNSTPMAYFPVYGYSQSTLWDVQGGTYTIPFGINIGGLRPDNRQEEITVSFAVNTAIVDAYNADITQQYSGEVLALPANCYSISGNTATVKSDEVSTSIPVVFDLAAIKAAGLDPAKRYVVPLELTGTSKYALHDNAEMTRAMLGFKIDEPVFYFYANRAGVALTSRKLVSGSSDVIDRYLIAGTGIPSGEYTVSVAYDPTAFANPPKSIVLPDGCLITPEDAFRIKNPTVTYTGENNRPEIEIEYDPSKLEFLKVYCLPITITSSSAYAPVSDSTKSIFIKMEKKNAYEKNYSSLMSITSDSTSRTAAYAPNGGKDPTSYTEDIIDMQMATNATIAGAGMTGTSSTYNYTYMRVKVIPTNDKSHYNVEFLRVEETANNKHKMSPETLEADPESESYYDWSKEQFVLNYRWRQQVKKKVVNPATGKTQTVTVEEGPWIHVSEILQAK